MPPLLFSGVVFAQDPRTQPEGDPERSNIGLRFQVLDLPSEGLAAGLDANHGLTPSLRLGAQLQALTITLGSDSAQHCHDCLFGGARAVAYGEGRALPSFPLTPYGRLGAGLGRYSIQDSVGRRATASAPVYAEAGIDGHYQYFSVRAFVTYEYLLGLPVKDRQLIGGGLQLGVGF